MVLCATIEGLLKRYATSNPIPVEIQNKVLSFLAAENVDQELTDRIGKLLEGTGHPRVSDVLHNWAHNGVLGICDADVSAWKSLRNSAMHGKLLFVGEKHEERQTRVDQLSRAKNLVNKLILWRADYRGKYFDYGTCQEREFDHNFP